MLRMMTLTGTIALVLTLGACAGAPAGHSGCCDGGSGGCMAAKKKEAGADAKGMKCDEKASCTCCSKGSAEGKPAEGHQH